MQPIIVERDPQPYVGRRESVTMTDFARVADHLPGMFDALGRRGVEVTGPPFFRYRRIDMAAELLVDAGIPVVDAIGAELPLFGDTLPGGRYVTVTHVGHPGELMTVTGRLLDWAEQEGLVWDMTPTPEGEEWGARLEVLMTDPREQPDMLQWRTDLFFKLAD
jgi:hypothetical protein